MGLSEIFKVGADGFDLTEAIATRVGDLIISPRGVLRDREWGLHEVGIHGPDGLLVRVGWPSCLMQGSEAMKEV